MGQNKSKINLYLNKRNILVFFATVIVLVFFYNFFIKEERAEFVLFEVGPGKIVEEVLATGQVKAGKELNLSFRTSGRIEKIYVKAGEEVKSGQLLAELEDAQLRIQHQEATAVLTAAQSGFNRLLAGARPEEIRAVEIEHNNNQLGLILAKNSLTDSYQRALPVLDSAHLSVFNAEKSILALQRKIPFYIQLSILIIEKRNQTDAVLNQLNSRIEKAKSTLDNNDIENALAEAINNLHFVASSLRIIHESVKNSPYFGLAEAELANLSGQQAANTLALNNSINSQQTISSMKLNLELAQNRVQLTENKLNLIKARPRQEDVDLYQAQVNQARARVVLLENQIQDLKLFSPINGRVTEVRKSPGELVQPMIQDAIIIVLPKSRFEIEAAIYEEDVIKVELGNSVDISLIPFPGKIFQGKVTDIDLAKELIGGVVYYKITIAFEQEAPEGIKTGMTADVKIITEVKEGVLTIPRNAIERKEGKTLVEVFKNGLVEKREIEIGIHGDDDMLEIISGLNQGEKIILR